MPSKYYQQYQSKYQNIKSIKSISRSIKITLTGDHHDTQITSNDRSSGHSNGQYTASDNVKRLIIPIIPNNFFNKVIPAFTLADNC